ncbi:MAG: CIA30 family protein [Polaribacter sp.]|jgi:NADH dehydrogenase [ubiquinone] 1 alpha subcomplex assembly factor 1|uniref:CIA30 family protein n=1 Tax=Polaribacter sp. TaxID=1920175 RepID=UPI00263391BB|nr:CIA30 family protein [Polaribacter sp.]MBT3742560.1 CIA30 family protein [Polaribacter sp.]MBT4413574.1 CIA30 family protein [Polaribacter sp.]MBT7817042.1 CIA30 family protein [Polaribacter sp.]MDG1195292.1 CIA30 family protein [Polaribacter sp.]MDG1404131.1 CIA30 family protein [Polaribacter sp.]
MSDSKELIFDFNSNSDISAWRVVDDVVMGGESEGNFKLNENGNGVYFGEVSLENNGGFSSLRFRFNKKEISNYSKIILKIKGDGKDYQFRVKDNYRNFYSYISSFSTNKNWQLIEINLSEMYPGFRGRKLEMSKFSSSVIEEIAFLIGNKRNESFKIEIDKIYLE